MALVLVLPERSHLAVLRILMGDVRSVLSKQA
jgi:hypothetical protein